LLLTFSDIDVLCFSKSKFHCPEINVPIRSLSVGDEKKRHELTQFHWEEGNYT
jgi:hypothetical protein